MEIYDWKYLKPVLGVEDLSNFDISNIFILQQLFLFFQYDKIEALFLLT